MMQERLYNIHSIICLRVRGDDSLHHEIELHLRSFRCAELPGPPDVVIDCYDSAPPTRRTTVVDDYEYDGGVYHRRATRVRMDALGAPQTYFMDRLAVPINLIVELALLKRGYTFLHGAGLLIEGRRVLFPAYPGTGKTTLVAAFVHGGARLFGDDLCVVGKGEIHAFPQALSVYPHHLPILKYQDSQAERAFRRTAFLDAVIDKLFSGGSALARLMRVLIGVVRVPAVNVDPVRVFGPDAVAIEGKLDEVCVLERSGEIDQLTIEDADEVHASRQASFILLHEWHASFHDLLLYDALSESDPRWTDRTAQVGELARQAFAGVRCRRIRIPASWDNARLVREFAAFWKQNL